MKKIKSNKTEHWFQKLWLTCLARYSIGISMITYFQKVGTFQNAVTRYKWFRNELHDVTDYTYNGHRLVMISNSMHTSIPFIHPSIYLNLSIHTSICPSIHLPYHTSFKRFIHWYSFINLSLKSSILTFFQNSIHPYNFITNTVTCNVHFSSAVSKYNSQLIEDKY